MPAGARVHEAGSESLMRIASLAGVLSLLVVAAGEPAPTLESLKPALERVLDEAGEREATVALGADLLEVEKNVHEFQVHAILKTGDIALAPRTERGPNANGFRIAIRLLPGERYQGALALDSNGSGSVPHPYWTLRVVEISLPASDRHLWLDLAVGARADWGLVTKLVDAVRAEVGLPPSPRSEPVSPLTLRLSCDRDSVPAGAEIPVHVFLENPSPAPVRVVHPKYNAFGGFRVVIERSDGLRPKLSHAEEKPYFYYDEPAIRAGGRLEPTTIADEGGVCTLPPGLVWEGILGSFLIYCGDDDASSGKVPLYLKLAEPGEYTIVVIYSFVRAEGERLARKPFDASVLEGVPELEVRSNALRVRVTGTAR